MLDQNVNVICKTKKVLLNLISTAIQITLKVMIQCVMDMVNVIVDNVYVMINMLGHTADV